MFVVQSTKHFGNALYPFVINLANARKPEETLTPLRDACISHDGSLMEMYTYISKLRQSFPLWVNHRVWFLSIDVLFHISPAYEYFHLFFIVTKEGVLQKLSRYENGGCFGRGTPPAESTEIMSSGELLTVVSFRFKQTLHITQRIYSQSPWN